MGNRGGDADPPPGDDGAHALLTADSGLHERDPLHIALEHGEDVIDPNQWAGRVPQTAGVTPRIRFGSRWVSLLWALPIAVITFLILIAVAKRLRETAGVQSFIDSYPGTIAAPRPTQIGIPWWARTEHFFNLFFMLFIIRSGLQILADHPRLYFDRNCTPGRDWFRFQKPVPRDRVWTAKEDSVRLPGWLGIPGLRHSIGLARWWHFAFDLLWLANGVIFYILVFATGHWRRIVPASWDVFPNALSTMIQYLSLDWPKDQGWIAYNGLQLLAYFITVFIAAPLALMTGLLQSPAISNRFRFAGRRLNHQLARTVHFWVLCWFLIFIFFHTAMVYTTGLLTNLNHITLGRNTDGWGGLGLYVLWMAIVIAAWALATPLTVRRPRLIQRVGRAVVGPIQNLFEHVDPRPGEYSEREIAPHLWPNGKMPSTEEYEAMATEDFAHYRLRIFGEVENPQELTLQEVKALPRQEQITAHHCIQGWSGVAKMGRRADARHLRPRQTQTSGPFRCLLLVRRRSRRRALLRRAQALAHVPPSHDPRLRAERGAAWARTWRAAPTPQRGRAGLQARQVGPGRRVRRLIRGDRRGLRRLQRRS
ncbi:MAG: cytochrome b/b6 domain-containing protein [Solirubrobacterales bacterium]|nr:cytochrome b/b6 domain-containing protein [Solirubrobacterales bacterium]